MSTYGEFAGIYVDAQTRSKTLAPARPPTKLKPICRIRSLTICS